MKITDDEFRQAAKGVKKMGEIHGLSDARKAKFLRDLEAGRYPALLDGWERVEQLIVRLEEGGMDLGDIVDAMFYSAAAEVFRREDAVAAEKYVRELVDLMLKDLVRNGPHHHDEAY